MPTISKDDLFRAILAMDVYHRMYNQGVKGLLDSGQIGTATLGRSTKDKSTIAGVEHEPIGFFAQEYIWNSESVVVYRGTDSGFTDASATGDIVNGYGVGAARPDGPQARAAVEFYKSIVDGDPLTANVDLIGQSLGGGLAGFVASLYGQDAVLFSNMNYERAARNAYDLARNGPLAFEPDPITATLLAGLGGVGAGLWLYNDFTVADIDAMKERIWGTANPTAPDGSKITTFSLIGEALSVTRIPFSSNETQFEAFASGGTAGTPGALERHSQAPFIIIAYGNLSEGGPASKDWQQVFPAIWEGLYRKEGAEATTILKSDPVKAALAEIAVQFAGDLALSKVLRENAPWAETGTFELLQSNRVLVADLDPEKWRATFNKDTASGEPKTGQEKIVGVDTLLASLVKLETEGGRGAEFLGSPDRKLKPDIIEAINAWKAAAAPAGGGAAATLSPSQRVTLLAAGADGQRVDLDAVALARQTLGKDGEPRTAVPLAHDGEAGGAVLIVTAMNDNHPATTARAA